MFQYHVASVYCRFMITEVCQETGWTRILSAVGQPLAHSSRYEIKVSLALGQLFLTHGWLRGEIYFKIVYKSIPDFEDNWLGLGEM